MRFLASLRLIESFVDTLQPDEISELRRSRLGISVFLARAGNLYTILDVNVGRLIGRSPPEGYLGEAPQAGEPDRCAEPARFSDKKAASKAIHKALKVGLPRGVGRESGIVEVRFRAHRPETAQTILKRYLEFYRAVVHRQIVAEFKTQRVALRDQYARAERTSQESEAALAEFTQRNGLLPGGDSAAAPFLKLLEKAIERVVEIREQKERIQSQMVAGCEPRISVLGRNGDDHILRNLNEQVAALETQYAEWKSVYSTNFPKMAQLREKIDYLRNRRDTLAKEAAAATLESATREEKLRERTSLEMRKDAEKMRSVQNQCMVLNKRVESDTRVCQKILTAMWDLDVRSHSVPSGMSVIEPPTMPSFPVAPKRGLVVAVGIALGVLCGIGSAFIMEKSARTTRVLDLDKIAADVNARSLGIVPDFRLFPNAVKRHAEPDLLHALSSVSQ